MRRLFALLAALPRPVRVLLLGSFVNRLGTFIVPYLTLVLRRDFELGAWATGALMFGYGLGAIVAVVGGGILTDTLGRRRTMLLSLLGAGGIAMAMAFSTSPAVFAAELIALGFLADLYRPASAAMVADLLPSSQRANGFAAVRMAVNLGFAVGMTVGGLLADIDWRLLFFGDGLTTCLFGLAVLAFVPESRPAASVADSAAPPVVPFWRDGVFMKTLAASMLFSIVFFADLSILPLTVTLGAGYPAIVYGVLVGCNGLVIGLCEVSAVDALSRFRRLRVAAVGVGLTALGFALNGVALHWAAFLVGVLVWTLGEILVMPQQAAFVADWAPAAVRGRYLGYFTATWSVAWALNPVLLLPLHAAVGDRVVWPLLALFALPAIPLLLHLDRLADHPERLRGREDS